MIQQIDQFQKFGHENLDAVVKTVGAMTKGAQTIALEAADYARKSFEQSSATVEKLVGARTLDKAVEIQTAYIKDAFKPYEGIVAKTAGTK